MEPKKTERTRKNFGSKH